MIKTFGDIATEDRYNGENTKRERKKLPINLHPQALRKLDMLEVAESLEDLKVPPGNKLEALKGIFKGKYSIRINDQYRIVFFWGLYGPEKVEIMDYH